MKIFLSLRTLSFLCCLLFTASNLASESHASVTSQEFQYFCDEHSITIDIEGNYTTNSTYHTNLNTLMSNILNNKEIDYGFYNVSYGEYPNRVYAIGLCRGDIKPEQCRTCLNQSRANLTAVCPNRKVAIGWYNDELCMLRYSNRSIFHLMDNGPAYYKKSDKNATDLNEFNTKLNDLLNGLKSKASSGDSRLKYAVGNFSLPNFDDVYGLVQCTPDLSGEDCDNCIAQSIERISKDCCKDSMGGRVVRPSCFMRFETSYQFYGPTAYTPPSPPAPQPTTTSVTNPSSGEDDNTEDMEIVESLQFNLESIRDATNDFSDANKLGQGGFGAVYKGILTNGQEIAVKRLARSSGQGDLEFKNEVLLLAKLQHRNLVSLLGFCLEGRERLLVYEFVPNKSLDYFIFGRFKYLYFFHFGFKLSLICVDPTKRANLDWESCHRIIGGIARGLVYLHEDSRLRIIHRDLKAANILLDEKMNPKISDFGTAKLFVTSQTHSNTNRIVGTYGYMAPEYQFYGLFSIKSDVYSFGVLVLEIVSGKKSSGNCQSENPETLMNFAWRNWKDGTISNIVDTTLRNGSQNEIIRCIHIALLCVQANEAHRPTMATVLLMLNNHSVTLAVPSEPAFLLNTGSNTSTKRPAQESVNEASITDPYPR
nr:putative receptor-like protein kinase At4g00960 [Arachis hypogaea]